MNTSTMNNLKVNIIEDYSEFLLLREEWDSLLDSMEHPLPFLTHFWIRILLESFGDINSLYIITVWNNKKLVGVLPLNKRIEKIAKVFRFSFLQKMPMAHCYNIICKLTDLELVLDAVKTFFSSHPKIWDVIILDNIPFEFGTVEKIIEKFDNKDMSVFSQLGNGAYYIQISDDFEKYFSELNKSFRNNRKNMNNKMSRKGRVEFKVIDNYDIEAINLFYDLENTGWKKQSGWPIKPSQVKIDCFNSIAKAFSENKQFLLTTLYVENEPVASIYGLLFKDTFYFYKLGVNYSYSECEKFSIGQAITYHMIKYCCENNIKRLDFFGPCYPYQAHWTKTINQRHTITIYNRRKLSGIILIVFKKTINFLKLVRTRAKNKRIQVA
ncbi:MAG: GNAT family N-acetyltransferase [Desulfuromonadaceae bacterium]|nr:GNAT family N-acetyltransferase [Desulfuromonadaceae bacterium]